MLQWPVCRLLAACGNLATRRPCAIARRNAYAIGGKETSEQSSGAKFILATAAGGFAWRGTKGNAGFRRNRRETIGLFHPPASPDSRGRGGRRSGEVPTTRRMKKVEKFPLRSTTSVVY